MNARLGTLLLALALLVSGCHATTGWDRGAPRISGGPPGAPGVVVPAEAYGRTLFRMNTGTQAMIGIV